MCQFDLFGCRCNRLAWHAETNLLITVFCDFSMLGKSQGVKIRMIGLKTMQITILAFSLTSVVHLIDGITCDKWPEQIIANQLCIQVDRWPLFWLCRRWWRCYIQIQVGTTDIVIILIFQSNQLLILGVHFPIASKKQIKINTRPRSSKDSKIYWKCANDVNNSVESRPISSSLFQVSVHSLFIVSFPFI